MYIVSKLFTKWAVTFLKEGEEGEEGEEEECDWCFPRILREQSYNNIVYPSIPVFSHSFYTNLNWDLNSTQVYKINLYTHLYIFCLSVFLSVSLSVVCIQETSKRLNRSGANFLWDLTWPQERLMDDWIF